MLHGFRSHCVRLKKTFHHKGHVCLVFPMLGPSLSDWMRENSSEPFPIDQVRTIGSQMLSAMECELNSARLALRHSSTTLDFG